MSITRFKAITAGLCAALLAGCQSAPTNAGDDLPMARNAPAACAGDFVARTPLLTLAPTLAPDDLTDSKSAPLRFANTLSIGKPLARVARLTHFDNGWSALGLRLRSAGAKSISVHLAAATLPPGTEVWLCAPDGRVRQGPYREAVGGDVWTPVVPGDEAWLEVLFETRRSDAFKATLAEIYGGFR